MIATLKRRMAALALAAVSAGTLHAAPIATLNVPLRALANAPLAAAKASHKRVNGLATWVMKNALRVARQINRTGGYRFDGVNDCYGFVRRTWNPILKRLHHPQLPVDVYPDPRWHRIASLDALLPGDVVGTVEGHRWGGDVHYGLYAGKKHGLHYQFDNTRSATTNGAHIKEWTGVFHYYYGPTHALLKKAESLAKK